MARLTIGQVDTLCLASLQQRYPILVANRPIFAPEARFCPNCLAGDGSAIQEAFGGPGCEPGTCPWFSPARGIGASLNTAASNAPARPWPQTGKGVALVGGSQYRTASRGTGQLSILEVAIYRSSAQLAGVTDERGN